MGPGKGQLDKKNGLIYLIYGAIKYSILIYCILITIISVSFTIYYNNNNNNNNNMLLLTYEQFQIKYNLRTNFIEYMGIRTSVETYIRRNQIHLGTESLFNCH